MTTIRQLLRSHKSKIAYALAKSRLEAMTEAERNGVDITINNIIAYLRNENHNFIPRMFRAEINEWEKTERRNRSASQNTAIAN